MATRLIIFLLANFGALGIGGLFTSSGVSSNWYASLDKAPWTPPGWVFGFAWTTIMICFTIYIALLWKSIGKKKLLLGLYIGQWILNVVWNPVFFHFHNTSLGLMIIISLTTLVGLFFVKYLPVLKLKSILILPYLVWLVIATSLNFYIVLNNQ